MKNYLLLIACIAFSGTCLSQTTYPSGVPDCIARWDFASSGTFASLPDVSSNGNTGAVANITATTGWRGGVNAAGSFNGTSSRATVSHNTMLSPSAITIVALVKFNGFYSGQCQDNNIIYKSTNYYSTGCWALKVTDNDGNCSNLSSTTEVLDFAGPAGSISGTTLSPIINTANWYLLAASYGGGSAKLYTVPMDLSNHLTSITNSASSVINTPLGSDADPVTIGATKNASFPYWFNGIIDELAVFNRVLADSEILSIYDYLWPAVYINKPFVDTVTHPGAILNVNYTVPGSSAFTSGNTFTVQMSDASGSFVSPQTIGTASATASGTIACTIPATAVNGTGYRIRIASTQPSFTSLDDGKNIKISNVGVTTLNGGLGTFNISPNPSTGSFTITGGCPSMEEVGLTVSNAVGQVVYQTEIIPSSNTINSTIQLPECVNGIYTVQLSNSSFRKALRLVVNK